MANDVQQIFKEYASRMRKSSRLFAWGMLIMGLGIGFQCGVLVAMLINMWGK